MEANPPAPLFGSDLYRSAQTLIQLAAAKGLKIALAESCTGGLVAGLLTEVPGSSAVIDRGFVTYSNEAKQDMLGVPPELLQKYGAVSAPVALAMAEGVLLHSRANLAIAVTGIAGPGGGSRDKPVGLVHFALAMRGQPSMPKERRFGAGEEDQLGSAPWDRSHIRLAAISQAIDLLHIGVNQWA